MNLIPGQNEVSPSVLGMMKKYPPSERMRRVIHLDLSGIPAGSRYNASRVLLSISNYVDQETLTTCVNLDKIRVLAGVSDKTVRRIIPMLENVGALMVKRRRKHGNLYMLMISDLEGNTLNHVEDIFKNGKNLAKYRNL